MSAITQAFYGVLCTDTVDTSPSNPSLLTLANRAPQRIANGTSIPATTVHPAAILGGSSFGVASATGITPGQFLYLGGPTPEVVKVPPGGVSGSTITLAAGTTLAAGHADGSLVSALASIVTTEEPRTVVTDPSFYWRIVIGPEHEHPVTVPAHRAPLRLYESLCTVKAYDSEPSRLLLDLVRDRLDFLLNLGDAGAQGNPDPLFPVGSSRAYVERCELVDSPEPHWDYSSLVRSVPLMFRIHFQKLYAATPSGV